MNKHVAKWTKSICSAICVGIGAIQFIYAMAWAVRNGSNVQDFYDSALYIENAVIMAGDGWRLMGYSVFLRLFMNLQSWLGSHYVILVYLVQVIISLFCYMQGCKTMAELLFAQKVSYKKVLLPAVYILTLPVVWQMQFAILPDALCVAIMILLFSKLAESVWNEERLQWDAMLIILGCMTLLSVLHRHYFYGALLLCAISSMIVLIRMVSKKYRNKENIYLVGTLLLCIVLTTILSSSVNAKSLKTEEYAQYSLTADMWDTFIYSNIKEDYMHYPAQVQDALPLEHVAGCDEYYERYMESIVPVIEGLAAQEAEEIYWQMIEVATSLHGKEMATGLLKEGVSYVLFPVAMIKYMYYNGNSLYGHNLIKMYETAPRLTVDYMHIGMNGFGLISLLGAAMCVMHLVNDRGCRKNCLVVMLYALAGIIVVVLPFMLLSVIKFDYRIGLFSAVVWGIIVLANIRKTISREQ